ncbi:methyltransferase family protein [Opitutaceae bacterium TAV1]|nr:methyltransferase family protein [Opitutaceae bacterium TAV1]
MNPPVEIWNRRYNAAILSPGNARAREADPWLARWLEDASGAFPGAGAPPLRALDLGCGAGRDTAYLLARGYAVTALDFSAGAIALSSRRNPAARHLLADLRDLDRHLPAGAPDNDDWHLVVASLSLHYFTREETLAIFAAIHARLRPGGLFAFRVNAFDERGAPPDPTSWAPVTSVEDGVPRQYFTEDKILTALAGRYSIISLRKLTIIRHGSEKSLYEVIVLKPEETTS